MLKESLIENDSITLGASASNWEEAIKIGTDMLIASGAVEARYYDEIVKKVKEMGPYIILAPGLAMPHARPEDGVKKTAFALVTLAEPVYFDGEDNSVQVLITLAGSDSNTHMQGIVEITELFEDEDPDSETGVDLESVLHCKSKEDVFAVIDKKIK